MRRECIGNPFVGASLLTRLIRNGGGTSLASSYPVRIGDKLRSLGIKTEGFNLGIAGNGALRNQIILRKVLEYQPSVVVLHVNNSNEFEDERDLKRAEEFSSWHPKNWLMKSLALRRLREMKTEKIFWKWIPAKVRNQDARSDADDELLAGQNPQTRQRWAERVRKYTAESVALARARAVPVLLLTQVRLERDASGRASLDDHGLDDLARSLVGPGVYHLSMKKILESEDFALMFADGSHVRPSGHDRIATAVVEKVRQEGLVAAP